MAVAIINVVRFRLLFTANNVFLKLLYLQIFGMMYNFLLQGPHKFLSAAIAQM